ncbi:hypothetical protein, conserved [Eimeria praecox]|uniref:Uncharacterized protein n=1 Tax=Eimeria praecox TaxID=51316 RepID=U6H472_9EIME|nr:hypothetical protein, conserved [Eimeria praecox]
MTVVSSPAFRWLGWVAVLTVAGLCGEAADVSLLPNADAAVGTLDFGAHSPEEIEPRAPAEQQASLEGAEAPHSITRGGSKGPVAAAVGLALLAVFAAMGIFSLRTSSPEQTPEEAQSETAKGSEDEVDGASKEGVCRPSPLTPEAGTATVPQQDTDGLRVFHCRLQAGALDASISVVFRGDRQARASGLAAWVVSVWAPAVAIRRKEMRFLSVLCSGKPPDWRARETTGQLRPRVGQVDA